MKAILTLTLLLAATSAFADFQYTQTTKITGGSAVQMMKMAGAVSRQARQASEPVTSTVLVKGNRMAHIGPDSTEITDLDRETITQIDHVRKQYSVMTFQQMKEKMQQAAQQARQKQGANGQQPEMNFKANVRNTGATRRVAGLQATESILVLSMEAKDKQSGQAGAIDFTNDMWMAPEIPGYSEVREFEQRFAAKMGLAMGNAMGSALPMQPGMAAGMGAVAKEMSKLKGVPVLQIMRVGSMANGEPLPAASEAPLPPSAPMPTAGEVAQESATSTVTSRLGGLGGMAAGLGGFGRKKKPARTEEQQASAQTAQNGAFVLVESTTERSGFSSASIASSRFEVPAGYKQMEPDR